MDNYRITNEMSIVSYTLDLKEIRDKKSISIIVGKYNIESLIKRRLVSSTPTWEMNLELDVEVNPLLKIRDMSKLLVINGGGQSANKITITQTSPNCPIEIQLNPEEIVDCTNPGAPGEYDVKYTLKSQYVEYVGIFSNRRHECTWREQDCGSLQIQFKELTAEPICSISTNSCNPVYNIAEDKVLVGYLQLQHSEKKYASAPLMGKFDLGLWKDKSYGDLLSLELSELNESGVYYEISDNVNLQTPQCNNSAFVIEYDERNSVYNFEGLYPNNIVSIPIYLKLKDTSLRNPINDFDEYKIIINPQKYDSYQYVIDRNRPQVKPETRCSIKKSEFAFRLQKDKSILEAALFFVTQDAGRDVVQLWPLECNDFGQEYQASKLPFNKIIANGQFKHSYKLRIKNLAGNQEENAAVIVQDFRVNDISFIDKGVNLLDASGKLLNLSQDIFTTTSCQDYVQLRASQCCDLTVTFNPQVVAKITNLSGQELFGAAVELRFSYSYYELAAGCDIDCVKDCDFNKVVGSLKFKLEMAPNAEWLCLDYGTSAVVAAYGELDINAHATDLLCDLRSAKAELLRKGGVTEEKRKTNDEEGTQFISSLIAINRTPRGQWNEILSVVRYADSFLWFSPADGMIDHNYVYPCLKSLMGYDKVPTTLFPHNNEVLQDTGLDKVDNLYPIVYKQMFEYYMPVDKSEIHKLVMSVPNTFAPVHLEKLATIARESLPNLRDDKLLFVSESDAIAYNYINRRASIININKSKLSGVSEDFDKRVLVYDMGAGTLDLTYFSKSQELANVGTIQGNSITVEIKGKIGISKSGNYVDYLIAEIIADLMRSKDYDDNLCKLYEQLLNLKRTSLSSAQNSVRFALKKFVKENVKHRLNNLSEKLGVFSGRSNTEENTNPTDNVGVMTIDLNQFTIADVVSHPKFKEFVQNITEDLFETFAAQCGDDNGNLEADLVIFSGRASSLNVVRKSVMDYFANKNKSCMFLDIATQEFITPDNMSTSKSINGLKAAVVEGAMVYATSFVNNPLNKIIDKNIYATYGLMLNIGNNQWHWQPMIDSNTQATGQVVKMGRTINKYDSSEHCCADGNKNLLLDFSAINYCYIIQTYDSKNALQNWTDNHREMMTVLGRIPGSDLAQFKGLGLVKTLLKVTEDNRIELHIGNGGNIAVLPHDDFEDISFRKSMWPIIWG